MYLHINTLLRHIQRVPKAPLPIPTFQRNILLFKSLISGFRRDVDNICALLGHYAASCGNCLLPFRDNVSVPSSRVKSPSRSPRNIVEERRSYLKLTVSRM
jgi:hypothetical protein